MVLCEDISMSGLFIASYKIIQDYHNSQLGEVDIFHTVFQMRDSGLGFVTSQEQYKFILKCLHDEAMRTEDSEDSDLYPVVYVDIDEAPTETS